MTGLLLLLVTMTPYVAAVEPVADSASPCAVAEEIARQRPCLKPSDCGAYQDWQRLFGPPGLRRLDPAVPAARRAGAAELRFFVCPARPRR